MTVFHFVQEDSIPEMYNLSSSAGQISGLE